MMARYHRETASRNRISPLLILVAMITGFLSGYIETSYAAEDFHRIDLQVYVDNDGKTKLQDILENPDSYTFESILGTGYAGGYRHTVHWFKFEVPALNPEADSVFLKFQPPVLDRIELYIPGSNGEFQLFVTGDLTPHNLRAIPYRGLAIPIPNAAQPYTAYVRLETSGPAFFFATLQTPYQFFKSAVTEYLIFGLYFGLLISGVVVTFMQKEWIEKKLYRHHLLYLGSIILLILGSEGFISYLLVPDSPSIADITTKFSLMAVAASSILYFRLLLLGPDTKHSLTDEIPKIAILFAVAGAISLAFGTNTFIARLTVITLVLVTGLLLIRSVRLLVSGEPNAKWLLLTTTLSLTGLLASSMSASGLLPGYLIFYYSFHLSTVLNQISVQLLMNARVNEIKESENAAHNLALQRETETKAEKAATELQSRFLSMIHHELRTPLSVIRLALGMKNPSDAAKKYARDAVENIDSIIERCAYTEKLDHAKFSPRFEMLDLKSLINEIISSQPNIILLCEFDKFEIKSDYDLLKVVFKNLIDNAVKYSSRMSSITIELSISGTEGSAEHIISVRNLVDHPESIDTEKIFERYVRMPSSEKMSGSGIGLFIVKGLLKALHGDIECRLTGNVIELRVCL